MNFIFYTWTSKLHLSRVETIKVQIREIPCKSSNFDQKFWSVNNNVFIFHEICQKYNCC